MDTIEKNDVDISPMFGWKKKFEIIDDSNGDTYASVWMRVLGDADLNKARVYALRKSSELRKKLKNRESDEAVIYLIEKDDIEKERLIVLILAFSMRDIMKKATKEVVIKYPVPPTSDAPLEEQEKFQKAIDDYPKLRQKELKKLTTKYVKKYESELQERDKDSLYSEYITSAINEMCEREVLNSFREVSAFLGTYKDEDCTERLFQSLEEFQNLRSEIKDSFISNYSTLELGMDELKKLRVATP